MTIDQKIKLAQAFGAKLQEEMTFCEFRAVIDQNKLEPEGSDVCHSHDYCDANMPMFAAFSEVIGHSPDLGDDADMELWNDAWKIAKAADFFI